LTIKVATIKYNELLHTGPEKRPFAKYTTFIADLARIKPWWDIQHLLTQVAAAVTTLYDRNPVQPTRSVLVSAVLKTDEAHD